MQTDSIALTIVDAGIFFSRNEASVEPFCPFISLGARYQIGGTRTDAIAGYSGGNLGLLAFGAQRSFVVGTVTGGATYHLSNGLDVFASVASRSGGNDHEESITAGVSLRF